MGEILFSDAKKNLLSLCNFCGMRHVKCKVTRQHHVVFIIWYKTMTLALYWPAMTHKHMIFKWVLLFCLPQLVQLVTNLEVLAGRFDGAAITGRIKGRVRWQAPWLSQLEVKTRGLSDRGRLSGNALSGHDCLAAFWCLMGAGGWTGCYRRSRRAAAGPRPFGRTAEVNLYCDYKEDGDKAEEPRNGGGCRGQLGGDGGQMGTSRAKEQEM